MKLPFFEELDRANVVLIAGAGGGYDIFSGLPLVRMLKGQGKVVHLAGLSSGALGFCDADNPAAGLWKVDAQTRATKDFPEMHLARWLSDRYGDLPIYAIEPAGAQPVAAAYQYLIQTLRPDTLLLIDGGTDSLMRGDEAGLGTPEGEAASLFAANVASGVSRKLLACIGFGIDTFHGVCHAHFLENVAALIGDDAFLGAWSLLRTMDEFAFYRDACDYVFARLRQQPSIVNSSVISAVNGSFGDHHATKRTDQSKLFVNPLMALYWTFRLQDVAQRNLYLECIQSTQTIGEVSLAIERFRDGLPKTRPWQTIPC